jgi:hypothetical protein
MKRIFISCCFLLAACSYSPRIKLDKASGEKTCSRILFIGDSYTFARDLPAMFTEMVNAGGI